MISPVKQFIKTNVKNFSLQQPQGGIKIFSLYDKNNRCVGEYSHRIYGKSEFYGVGKTTSNITVFNSDLKRIMQESTIIQREYVDVKDPFAEEKFKGIVKSIEIITTTLDYLRDKFRTVSKSITLKNKLTRIDTNDKDFIYSDKYIIYKELPEKLKYERQEKIVREGSIKEANDRQKGMFRKSNFPYKYW